MINNIQIIRAMAVLMVVAYHSVGLLHRYGFDFNDYSGIGTWGAFGVDLFFVISGYVIAMIDNVKKKTPIAFFKDRVIRIVPIYWFFTLLMIFTQACYPDAFRMGISSSEQNISSMLFLSHFMGYAYPTLYVGWSLELEMAFYAIFAIFLLSYNRIIRSGGLVLLVVLMVFLGLMKPIAIEFLFGVCLYYIINFSNLNNKFNSVLFAPAVVFLIVVMALIDAPTELSSWLRALVIGIISFIVVAVSIICVDSRKNIVTYIGDMSYSIYLVQVFSLPLIMKLSSRVVESSYGFYVFCISILFTILIGSVFYEVVEKKVVNIMKGKYAKVY